MMGTVLLAVNGEDKMSTLANLQAFCTSWLFLSLALHLIRKNTLSYFVVHSALPSFPPFIMLHGPYNNPILWRSNLTPVQ